MVEPGRVVGDSGEVARHRVGQQLPVLGIALGDLVAERAQQFGGFLDRPPRHRAGLHARKRPLQRHRDAQTTGLPARRVREADLRLGRRVSVAGGGPAYRVVEQRGIEHASSQAAEHRQPVPVLGVGQRGDAPPRRLEPEQPAQGRRNPDGGTAVGAQPDGREARRDGGGRAAARPSCGPLGVPRVARGAVRARLGHVAPHGQLGQRRLAQHGRPGGAQAAHHLGVARGGRLVRAGAVTGDLAGDVDVVLHGDGHAEQWARLAGPQALERRVGLGQRRLGADRHEGVELRIEALDALDVELDQLARRDLARPEQLGQAGDAREGEIAAGRGGRFGRPLR